MARAQGGPGAFLSYAFCSHTRGAVYKPLGAPMDSLTVVIPTFNRAPVLKKALEAYLTQGAPEGIYELLVVDDGSTDETPSLVDEISRRAPFPIRYFRQENKGPAAARNVGIREAQPH